MDSCSVDDDNDDDDDDNLDDDVQGGVYKDRF